MNCEKCGGKYIEKSGDYELFDRYVGKIIIHGIKYYQCDNCNNILYSEEMAQAIETERDNRVDELLSQYPIRDFISASETASFLDISRQALHKNRRINRGFIYQTSSCGSNVYLRQSVKQYKETGDGRFPLQLSNYVRSLEYIKETIPVKIIPDYVSLPRPIKPTTQFTEGKHAVSKEYNYAN
jgi:hypothetical protein